MKYALLLALSLPSAFAATDSALLGPLSCGGYKKVVSHGVSYDDSKYSIALDRSLNAAGSDRAVTLYENKSSGSYEVAQGHGCSLSLNNLICQFHGVILELPMNQMGQDQGYGIKTFKAFVTVGSTRLQASCNTAVN